MKNYKKLSKNDLRLSLTSRIFRLAIGALLFAIPLIQHDAPAVMAVLPLLAIYPTLTGILGFGLVEVMDVSNRCRSEGPSKKVKLSCTCLLTVGTGIIIFVMGNEILPAWVALAAMFLLLMAILGLDQVGKIFFGKRALETKNESTDKE